MFYVESMPVMSLSSQDNTVRSFGSYQSAALTRITYLLDILMIKVTKVTSQASIQHRT
jgi:hypothetical protein